MLKDWLKARVDGGVLPEHSSTDRMRIRLCNRIALTDMLNIILIPCLVLYFTGMWSWALVLAIMITPNVLPLWLNPLGHYSLARASSIISGCIWIPVLAYVMGEHCRVELGLIIVLAGTMITVPTTDPTRRPLMALPVLSAITLYTVRLLAPWPGAVPLEHQGLVFLVAFLLCAYNLADRVHTMSVSADERDAELQAANTAKSAFLAQMTHELRTPLAGVIGLTSLALDPKEGDDPHALLVQSQRSAHHLMDILSGVLDLSKIEAGAMELEVVDFDLSETIEASATLIRPRAQDKALQVEVRNALPTPCWRRGDPLRVKQVLINLLSNAIKFTPTGRITLSARLTDEDEVELVVADTGIGMTGEQVEQVFAPFQQAESSTSRRFGGTGLGLTISKQLTMLSGGSLHCESTPGQGSRFTVRLPLPPGVPARPAAAPAPESEPPPPLAVLVAEDNPVNQLVVQKLLARLGQTPTLVSDGQEAVDACAGVTWDLILMDMQMPRLDGLEATRALRAAGYTGPIWALTANAMRSDLERCRQAGMDEVLIKPVSLSTLHQALSRIARGERHLGAA